MYKYLLALLIAALFVTSCTTPRTGIGDPNDPSIAAQSVDGAPVPVDMGYQPTALDNLLSSLSTELGTCPLYQYPPEVLTQAGLDATAQVHVCNSVDEVQSASFGLVALTALPARIEPSKVGEEIVGVVLAAGKVVGIIVLTAQLAQYGTSVIELNHLNSQIVGTGTLELPRGWDRTAPERVPWEALDKEAWHSVAKHWAYACITYMARRVVPDEVFYSNGSSKRSEPSVLFLWEANKAIQGPAKDAARCATLGANLWREFKDDSGNPDSVLPVLDDLYLGLAVGYDDVTGRWFTLSGYIIEKHIKIPYLCGWGYTEQLYPVAAIVPCN